MAYLPVSAFQRPMTYIQLERAEGCKEQSHTLSEVDKWVLFRALVKAQKRFSLNDRDLALLQGLLSFYPHPSLQAGKDMILFPANKTICERMNGMPDSTMRRHLRNLLASGLILRRDSNNGKRFSTHDGETAIAFGFDLTPLLQCSARIFAAAAEEEEAQRQARRLRLEIQLMRRDLYSMIPLLDSETGAKAQIYWEEVTKSLRRKLNNDLLEALHRDHEALLIHLKTMVLNSSDSQNEQHKQNSNIKYYESEYACEEIAEPTMKVDKPLSLETVIQACPELENFYGSPIHDWRNLVSAVQHVYKAIGITEAIYNEAVQRLGLEQASIVIAALLQRFEKIRSPGAYLRSLILKASKGQFSCKPMIMALIPA